MYKINSIAIALMFLAILKPMKKDDYLYALIFEISYTDADGIFVFEASVCELVDQILYSCNRSQKCRYIMAIYCAPHLCFCKVL